MISFVDTNLRRATSIKLLRNYKKQLAVISFVDHIYVVQKI